MSEFKYSIIIPHKNSPSLLARCVSSIPQRSDVQLIIVDDNSDPSIVDFDHFPVQNDERITVVFDKSGLGAGHARNIGMGLAIGEKLVFADADDFFNYCFKEALEDYKNDTSDIVFFNVSSCDSETYVNNRGRSKFRNELVNGYEKNPKLFEYFIRYECGAMWGRIIRRGLVVDNHITCQESIVNNDTRFSYTLGHLAKSVKVDRRAIYCVTYSQSSISYTMTDEKYLTRMHIISTQLNFCKSNSREYTHRRSYAFDYLRDSLVKIRLEDRKELYRKCMDILSSYNLADKMKPAVRKRLLYKRSVKFVKKMIRRS